MIVANNTYDIVSDCEQPLISVIIPVYNVESYLHRCVDSVLSQTLDNIEVILIDDGSNDRSGKICDEYASRDDRVIVIHKKNGGVSSARNAGLRIASGDYIGFVDADDYIDIDMYEYLYFLAEQYEVDIVQCGMFETYTDRVVAQEKSVFKICSSNQALRESLKSEITSFHIFNKLFRRNVLVDLRFVRLRMSEDAVFIIEAELRASSVLFTNVQKYHYIHRLGSAVCNTYSKDFNDSIIAFDRIYRLLSCKPDELRKLSYSRRVYSRVKVLDRIYLEAGEHDTSVENRLVREIRKNIMTILTSSYLTPLRRFAVLLLLFSRNIYKKTVRYYYSKNRLV